jgi:hypothetical protein
MMLYTILSAHAFHTYTVYYLITRNNIDLIFKLCKLTTGKQIGTPPLCNALFKQILNTHRNFTNLLDYYRFWWFPDFLNYLIFIQEWWTDGLIQRRQDRDRFLVRAGIKFQLFRICFHIRSRFWFLLFWTKIKTKYGNRILLTDIWFFIMEDGSIGTVLFSRVSSSQIQLIELYSDGLNLVTTR